jgi:hypothetical protein
VTAWDNTDLRALRRIGAGLGSFQVLKIEENSMTEAPQDQAPWDNEPEQNWDGSAKEAPSFPELPSNPHNHVYTWSPKLPDGSMLVIRANTAAGLAEAAEALGAVAGRLRTAWGNVTGGPAPAPQAPAQGFPQAPQGQPNYNPQMPPPNQPYPGQPAWQQAGAPQAPMGGGLPAGWYRLTVPYQQKATFDGIVTQYGLKKGDPFKGGQVSWRKEQKFWACDPSVAQAFAQFNPVPA